jgi:hypothetical protein
MVIRTRCHDSLEVKAKGVAKRKTRVSKKVVVEKPIVRRSLRIRKIKIFDFYKIKQAIVRLLFCHNV